MTLEKVFEPLRHDMEAVDVELKALMKRVGSEMDPAGPGSESLAG